MTNMTYAMALDTAINFLNDNIQYGDDFAATVEKLEALKAQLAKRGSSKTPTKTQKENEIIMERILDSLAAIGSPTTVTDLLSFGVEGYTLTNQKTSALLRKLVEEGKVSKTIEGKKAMFSIA